MKAQLDINGLTVNIDFSRPLDISLPLSEETVNAFYLSAPRYEPFRAGSFVGSIALGGACNCETITLNPHGNGTHTECVGHISRERISINQCLNQFMHRALLVSIQPQILPDGDSVIGKEQLAEAVGNATGFAALLIRTLPNDDAKRTRQYSGTNPTYIEASAGKWLREQGILHLLVDFPSVDREEDGGVLAAHHEFWHYPENPRFAATITEMIYVPAEIPDGTYLLNLQIIGVESDASPSKPILYAFI